MGISDQDSIRGRSRAILASVSSFFFSAYERLDRHQMGYVPLLRNEAFLYDLTPSQQELADALANGAFPPHVSSLAQLLSTSLIPGSYAHVVSLFEDNSGLFPFAEERQQFMSRFDHAFGPGHNLFLRGNWTGQDSENTDFGALVARNRGRNKHLNDFSLALGNSLVMGPKWIGETWLGKESLSQSDSPQLAAAVDEPVTSLQAHALGLPLAYQQGFGDPHWTRWSKSFGFFVEDSWRVHRSFLLTLGVRYDLFRKSGFPQDNNNFGPRAGFAWSPDPKTVLRGGYGIFFARINRQITHINDLFGEEIQQIIQVYVPRTGIPGIESSLTGQPLTSSEIYQSLFDRSVLGRRSIVAEDLAMHGLVPARGLPFRVGFEVAEFLSASISDCGRRRGGQECPSC